MKDLEVFVLIAHLFISISEVSGMHALEKWLLFYMLWVHNSSLISNIRRNVSKWWLIKFEKTCGNVRNFLVKSHKLWQSNKVNLYQQLLFQELFDQVTSQSPIRRRCRHSLFQELCSIIFNLCTYWMWLLPNRIFDLEEKHQSDKHTCSITNKNCTHHFPVIFCLKCFFVKQLEKKKGR